MTVHVSIDLETWGTLPGSALRSIGAVTFSPYGDGHTEQHFYANIDLQSCMDVELSVNRDTAIWWRQQSIESQQRLEKKPDATSRRRPILGILPGKAA